MICIDGIRLDLVQKAISYQFIGFLYMETSFENIMRVLYKSFDVYELIFVQSYLSILNAYSAKHSVNFEEISKTGLDHETKFTYKLTVDEKNIFGSGQSKKQAKNNCAELFCEKYLRLEDLKKYSGIKITNHKVNRVYSLSLTQKKAIGAISNQLKIDEELIKICCTHKSFSNQYNLDNNSDMVNFGAEVERLYLQEYIYEKLNIHNHAELMALLNYLHTNGVIYNKINNYFALEKALLFIMPLSGNSYTCYADSIKALFNVSYFSNNPEIFKNIYIELCDEYVKTIEPYDIEPITILQNFLQSIDLDQPTYNEQTIDEWNFQCGIEIRLPSAYIHKTCINHVKQEAKNNVAKEALKYIKGLFDDFCVESNIPKVSNYDNTIFENFIIELIKKLCIVSSYIKGNNYFGYDEFANGNLDIFVIKIYKILRKLIKYVPNQIIIDGLEKLKKYTQCKFIPNTKVLLSTAVEEIYMFCISNQDANYNVNINKLIELSNSDLEKLISKNGFLIKNIISPAPKLQLLAVNSNIEAFFYIKNPSIEVLDYVNKNSTNRLEVNETNMNQFIEIKKLEISTIINKAIDSHFLSIILDNYCFDVYLNALFQMYKVNQLCLACGYVFKSGLDIIAEQIHSILDNDGTFKLIAGNLQDYLRRDFNKQMDKGTAKMLNNLISNGCEVKTYKDNFYHGKLYILTTDNYVFVITGSTNCSRNAFRNNNELDTLFIFNNKYPNEYLERFNKLWNGAISLDYLDIDKFAESAFTVNDSDYQLQTISNDTVKEEINRIPDELLKTRLMLWLDYVPTNIYENINVANNN